MKDHPNPNVQPASEPYGGPNGLDPSPVDTETPDVNPGVAERCQVIEATTADGQPLTFAVHTLAPLTEREQELLGGILQAAAVRMQHDHPHAGAVQELMLAWSQLRIQPGLLGAVGHVGAVKDRVSEAIRAVRTTLDVMVAERSSRFRWAEEAARLEAELEQLRAGRLVLDEQVRKQGELIGEVTELLALPSELNAGAAAPTVVELARWAKAALDGWELRLADIQAEMAKHLDVHERQQARAAADLAELRARAETAIDLIDEYDGPHGSFEDHPKWTAVRDALRGNPEPVAWSCKCGLDVTDMVHTAERCYSTTEPVSEVDGVS